MMEIIAITFLKFAAVAALIYGFSKEREFVAFEKVLSHNIRVAVVRCLKRSKCFMAWLNKDASIAAQVEADYKPRRAFLRTDWRNNPLCKSQIKLIQSKGAGKNV